MSCPAEHDGPRRARLPPTGTVGTAIRCSAARPFCDVLLRRPEWAASFARERDHLREHQGDAAEDARLKAALAAADDRDRPRYRAGKAPFTAEVLRRLA